MYNCLKQVTGPKVIKVGPVVDNTGAYVTTAVVGDFLASKGGGDFGALDGSATAIYDSGGMYTITLTANDTDTLGLFVVQCQAASTICPPARFQVLRAGIYATLVAGTALAGGVPLTDASDNLLVYLRGVSPNGVDTAIGAEGAAGRLATNLLAFFNAAGCVAQSGDAYSRLAATPPTAAQVATAVWQDLVAGTDFTTAASVGVLLNALAKACGATGTVAATKAAGAAGGLPVSDASNNVPANVVATAGVPEPRTFLWVGDGDTNSYATPACYLLNGVTPASVPAYGDRLIVDSFFPGYGGDPAAGTVTEGVEVIFTASINGGTVGSNATFKGGRNMGTAGNDTIINGPTAQFGTFTGDIIVKQACDLTGATIGGNVYTYVDLTGLLPAGFTGKIYKLYVDDEAIKADFLAQANAAISGTPAAGSQNKLLQDAATAAGQTTLLNAVNAITVNTARSGPVMPGPYVRPQTGTKAYTIRLRTWNLQGVPETPDAAPTIHATIGGVSYDAALSSTTMSAVAGMTNTYDATFTVQGADQASPTPINAALIIDLAWDIGGVAMNDGAGVVIIDEATQASLDALQTAVNLLKTHLNTARTDGSTVADDAKTAAAQSTAAASSAATAAGHNNPLDATQTAAAATAALTAKTEYPNAAATGMAADYQQRGVAVTLPAAPAGYGGLTQQQTADALNLAPAGEAATGSAMQLLTAESGPGGIATTITCKTTGGAPLQGVSVWCTSDAAGQYIVAGKLTTDVNGEVVFMLAAGTYYVWRQLAGENFTNPQAIAVA